MFPGSLGHEFKKVGGCGTGEDIELRGLDFDIDVSGSSCLTIRVRIIECRKSCHHFVVVLVDKSTKFVSSDKHRVVLKRRIREADHHSFSLNETINERSEAKTNRSEMKIWKLANIGLCLADGAGLADAGVAND